MGNVDNGLDLIMSGGGVYDGININTDLAAPIQYEDNNGVIADVTRDSGAWHGILFKDMDNNGEAETPVGYWENIYRNSTGGEGYLKGELVTDVVSSPFGSYTLVSDGQSIADDLLVINDRGEDGIGDFYNDGTQWIYDVTDHGNDTNNVSYFMSGGQIRLDGTVRQEAIELLQGNRYSPGMPSTIPGQFTMLAQAAPGPGPEIPGDAIPEPTGLFGIGALALALFKRRSKRRAAPSKEIADLVEETFG